jgi:hypothetical protein
MQEALDFIPVYIRWEVKMQSKPLLSVILIILLYGLLSAQGFQIEQPPADHPRIDLTFLHPSFESDYNLTALSGIYHVDLNFPVSKNLNLVLGIPYSTWSSDTPDTEHGFGNFFAGIQTRSSDTTGLKPSGTFGVFFPTASEDKSYSNILSMYTQYQHFYRYVPNVFTIVANGDWYGNNKGNSFYILEFGSRIWIPTGTESDNDVEVILNYGVNGGVEFDPVAVSLEVAGQFFMTSDQGAISDRFTHTLSFGMNWIRGNFNPSIFYSLYLKENLSDVVTGMLGIRFCYTIE